MSFLFLSKARIRISLIEFVEYRKANLEKKECESGVYYQTPAQYSEVTNIYSKDSLILSLSSDDSEYEQDLVLLDEALKSARLPGTTVVSGQKVGPETAASLLTTLRKKNTDNQQDT